MTKHKAWHTFCLLEMSILLNLSLNEQTHAEPNCIIRIINQQSKQNGSQLGFIDLHKEC